MNINECPNCQAEIKAGTQVCPHCGYAFPFATDLLEAGRVLQNRYELVKLIHSGGMGYIYLAQDKRLDREVVVKQVRQPVKSDAHRKKLEEEALRMAHLKHPAVAMVFDHFVEDDFYFLVVEFIKGQTLNEIFEKSGRKLEESQVTAWMVQVCDVIGYLHDKDMVHRDISPDNIMLTEDGHIKLIDFGTLHDLSMLAGKKAGKEGKFGFTPKEQWDGQPVPQSDVFSIGATTYYLLTGYLPISEQLKHGGKQQDEDFKPKYPPIKQVRADVSQEIEGVLQKALAHEIDDRYTDAVELHESFIGLRLHAVSSAPLGLTEEKASAILSKVDPGHVRPGTGSAVRAASQESRHWKWIVSVLAVILIIGTCIGLISMPSLSVATVPVSFINLKPGSISESDTRTISNSGKSPLKGTVKSDALWLHVSPLEIDIKPGQSMDFSFHVDTSGMAYGQQSSGTITIDTNGGKVTIPVNLSITKVIFEDDFSDPNSGWTDGGYYAAYGYGAYKQRGYYAVYGDGVYKQGGYSIKVIKAEIARVVQNKNLREIDDFIVETDAKWLTAESSSIGTYGIVFFGSWSILPSAYVYAVDTKYGGYQIYWYDDTSTTTIKGLTASPAVNICTAVNRLKVVRQGSNLKFYINDILLTTLTDNFKSVTGYSSNKCRIGLSVPTNKSINSEVEALFDNFKVSVP